jgi:hypothetical protein
MYFIYWLYSLFVRPSPTKQTNTGEPSICCDQNSAKQEIIHQKDITPVHEKYIFFENRKLIEKIRSYGILEEYEYKYIKELPNEQLLLLFRNLQ